MPLLGAEPTQYPDSLFDDLRPAEAGEGRQWWVVHTKPRQEKSLARQLIGKQPIPFYLPLVTKRRRIRGRTQTSYMPLFPGYLFLLANRDERLAALTTNRIAQTLEVKDQQRLWSDLKQIHQLILSGAPITREERLEPGMPVEITSGPLAGLKGKVVRSATGKKFIVQVDFLQQGASVLLENYELRALDE